VGFAGRTVDAPFQRGHGIWPLFSATKTLKDFFLKSIVEEKISLNVSDRLANPACIAGVRISRPNFSAM
jgi:hypothetical protein